MSEADKMFYELGYRKMKKNEYYIGYCRQDDENIRIEFGIEDKDIEKYCFMPFESTPERITMQELQAINKKVEELGWKK